MRQWILFLWLATPGLSADVLPSDSFAPAILFNSAIVLDGSYNESLLAGMEQFEQRKGVPFTQMATADLILYRQSLESLARAGHSPIIVPGGGTQSIVEAVAPSFPETTFISIGYQTDAPNVRSILFREWDGAYLAGVLAAYRSPNRKVAFMGGLPVRSVKELEAGFRAGFNRILPDGQITSLYLSEYSDRPWDDESKAKELGRQLFSSEHDIVFAAAGSSGKGALAAAAEAGKLAIGVDQNQNGLYPGHVLTSVVKHLDRAVYVALISERWQLWRSPVKRLGLAQGGVSISIDENNLPLLSEDMMVVLQKNRSRLLAESNGLEGDTDGVDQDIAKPQSLIVAVPDEVRFPFIQADDSGITGIAIDALGMLSRQLGVEFEYQVLPIRRGVHSLGESVDGFIAISHSDDTERRGVFPMRDGDVDEDRALMTWDLAAFQLINQDLADASILQPPITIPPGSGTDNLKELQGLESHVIGSVERQLNMLLRRHAKTALADALHADHLIDNRPEFAGKIRKVAASVSKESSYLVLSKAFYQQYPEFSEILWNRLSEIRESFELWDGVDRYFR
ncbi:BMP family ABC transporter substrate-binding protein [Marinobacter adhaerens]|uniref:BMP family ABC transporter substrate-binding protein n=1 Tax=Marinobacter adhaerens TaxID=1033846 RepID=UPI001E6284BE|nr:BMP family ABC transporter substrate-binding protein [Marinobacter adhaerens]MCD1646036.1 BMP family ABC transporter substrate-binding protein [Marinobacter adhaerens]